MRTTIREVRTTALSVTIDGGAVASHDVAYALAALAHGAMLLERLLAEIEHGDELVARLIARAQVEAIMITMYLTYGRAEALETLAGAYKRVLSAQSSGLNRADTRIAMRAAKMGHSAPRQPLSIDMSEIIKRHDNVKTAKLNFEEIGKRLEILLEERGEFSETGGTMYELVYRLLSNHGAHSNLWVLDQYLRVDDDSGSIAVVPESDSSPMSEAMVRGGAVMLLMAAQGVFERFGMEVASFEKLRAALDL